MGGWQASLLLLSCEAPYILLGSPGWQGTDGGFAIKAKTERPSRGKGDPQHRTGPEVPLDPEVPHERTPLGGLTFLGKGTWVTVKGQPPADVWLME